MKRAFSTVFCRTSQDIAVPRYDSHITPVVPGETSGHHRLGTYANHYVPAVENRLREQGAGTRREREAETNEQPSVASHHLRTCGLRLERLAATH